MINLPSSTFVGKVVPKEKFYNKCAVNTATKNLFVKYVEQIVWQNKLTAQTMAAEKGLLVNEIDVFEVKMKSFECPRKLFEFIDQNLHHHNVFILTYDDKAKPFWKPSKHLGNPSPNPYLICLAATWTKSTNPSSAVQIPQMPLRV